MTVTERLVLARAHRNRAAQMQHWAAFRRYQAYIVRMVILINLGYDRGY